MRMPSGAAALLGVMVSTGAATAQHGDHEPHDEQTTALPVDGEWDLSFRAPWGDVEMRLDLSQNEHRLRGFALWGSRRVQIDRGRVDGTDVSFVIVAGDGVTHSIDMLFEGQVRDDVMHGTVGGWDGAPSTWTAERKGT